MDQNVNSDFCPKLPSFSKVTPLYGKRIIVRLGLQSGRMCSTNSAFFFLDLVCQSEQSVVAISELC